MDAEVDVERCRISADKWRCPAETCQQMLSRKQTLINHVTALHPQLKIVVEGRRGTYKNYELDQVPRTTLWKKRKFGEIGEDDDIEPVASVSGLCGESVENTDSDSDMSLDSELNSDPEESVYVESSEEDEDERQEINAANVSDQTSTMNDPPLYVYPPSSDVQPSDISKSEHIMAIGAFATRHHLSNAAISDLLKVIELHIPGANTAVDSVKSLKEACGFDKNFLSYKMYCSICKKLSENSEEVCQTPGCSSEGEKKEYFVTANIECQLKELFERPGIYEKIEESRNIPDSDVISDIKSGEEYKKLKEPGGFMDNTKNITLSMFTDGVPLFKSSAVSLWPVYLLVNELPPKERFLQKNMLLWGIWQGSGKPNMISFLKPLVQDLNKLYHNGFEFFNNSKQITSKAMLVVLTMDLQARAYLLQMTHHNGEFGCVYCLEKGESVPSGKGHCRSYDYNENPKLRTDQDVLDAAGKARATGKRESGFHGESVFLYLVYFSIVNNVVIDYMHGALLGVTKKLLELWFEPKFSSKPWYIGQHMKDIDNIIRNIKPPYFIHRRPRIVSKTYYHWKASELRNWLLFFSIPCLKPYLPNIYLIHFSCLAEAIYILLGEGITVQQLSRAQMLLNSFVKNFKCLYGPEFLSLNVHNLLHLTMIVKKWGPLWCWSCFPYESFNGDIMKTIHGTGNVCKDVFWSMHAQKRVERKLTELPSDSHVRDTLQGIVSLQQKQKHSNAKQCHVIKAEPVKSLSKEESEFLNRELGCANCTEIKAATKVIHNGFIMYSSTTKRVKKQNSYTIMMHNETAIQVKRYLLDTRSGQVFASGKTVILTGPVLPNRMPHIQETDDNALTVVKIGSLREPLVVVEVQDNVYLALLPNHHETD